MALFKWKGKNLRGEDLKGEIEGVSKEEVERKLRAQGIIPSKISKVQEIHIPFLEKKVTLKDIVVFTRQFSTMIEAGLPLTQGLDILAQQSENKKFRQIINGIKVKVESGNSLSASIGEYKKVFTDLYVNMINAGEISGNLDVILQRLAMLLEKTVALRRKVKGALFYPVTVIIVATIVTSILLIKVVPTFAEMFSSMGRALPLPTQIVINVSNFLRHNLGYIIGVIFLLITGIRLIYKTEKGRYFLDGLMLKFPIFGELVRKAAIAKFSRTLGTMLSSGVSILEAFDIVAKTSGNVVIEKALYFVRDEIKQGKTIAEPLSEVKTFPPMVVQMLSVGEKTGQIDTMLNKIADFYEDEVDQMVSNLTSIMEPLIMVFLGGVLGTLIVAMYLPIFKIGELM